MSMLTRRIAALPCISSISCQYVHPLRQEATTAVQEAPKKEDTAGEDDAQYGNSQVSRAGMGARRAVQSYRHTGCRKGEKGGWCLGAKWHILSYETERMLG